MTKLEEFAAAYNKVNDAIIEVGLATLGRDQVAISLAIIALIDASHETDRLLAELLAEANG